MYRNVYIYIWMLVYIYTYIDTGRLVKIHETFVYWLWLSLWTTTNPNKNPSILKLPKFPDNFPPAAGSTPPLANFRSEKQLRFDKTHSFSCNSKIPEFSGGFACRGCWIPYAHQQSAFGEGLTSDKSSDDWLKRPLVTSPPSGSKDRKAVCSTQSKTSKLLSLGGTTRSQSLVAKSHEPKETEILWSLQKENSPGNEKSLFLVGNR